jgi:hypothetical protein
MGVTGLLEQICVCMILSLVTKGHENSHHTKSHAAQGTMYYQRAAHVNPLPQNEERGFRRPVQYLRECTAEG